MYIKGKNPHGGDIYRRKILHDFSANTSPLGTPEAVKEAIRFGADFLTAYPDPYCYGLREKIAEYQQVEIDQVICGNGAAEVIVSYVQGLKPQNALLVVPTFCEYEEALVQVGCNCHYYTLKEEQGFSLELDILAEITKEIDLVVICNPNNPTGKRYSADTMLAIAEHCKAMECALFVDECFYDLTDGDTSLSTVIKDNPYLFVLKAFTKSYGMAGVRLGYGLCSNEALMEEMTQYTQCWNVSTLAQLAGITALDCTEHLAENCRIIRTERPRLIRVLEHCGFTVFPSDVNFILFKAPVGLHAFMESKGIAIRDCSNFVGLGAGYFRCAVRSAEENNAFIMAVTSYGV